MKTKHINENKRLNYLHSEIDALYHMSSLKLGISDSVSIVMYAICDLGEGCMLSDIYKSSGVSKQTVNSAIRSLEAKGVLLLKQADGRSKRVYLTDKGREFERNTAARLLQAELDSFDDWTEDEISALIRLTEKYLRSFRAEIERM